MFTLELDRQIQVRSLVEKGKWDDVKVLKVLMGKVSYDGEGNSAEGVSMTVEFEDGTTRTLSDIFTWLGDEWRYKEKCCKQCKWESVEGGDIVPYGATTATLPETHNCENEKNENVENPYESTDKGRQCLYHEF